MAKDVEHVSPHALLTICTSSFFIVLLGGDTLWHLHKLLQCIEYIILSVQLFAHLFNSSWVLGRWHFFNLPADVQFSHHYLLKRLHFLQRMFWAFLLKLRYSCMGLCLDLLFYSNGLNACDCASIMLCLLLWLHGIIWSQIFLVYYFLL
jgi:hypothetical protein